MDVPASAKRSPGSLQSRAAGVLYASLGVGFGVGVIASLWHLARNGELPMTPFGFRAFSGPFEDLGRGPFMLLAGALAGVCALDVLAGVWLWQGRRRGATLGLATTPLAFGLSLGFALPFQLVGIPIRAALALAARRRLP
jgi:hypothetical protein